MTKLENDIFLAMQLPPAIRHKSVVEVARKYITRAFDDGIFWRERYCEGEGESEEDYEERCQEASEKWLKENGISE